MENSACSFITASLVPEAARPNFLASKLGLAAASFETYAYSFMDSFCPTYAGGYWHFVELSNGGFYIYLDTDEKLGMAFPNFYVADGMAPETAGIIITLYALSNLSFEVQAESVAKHYHLLRDFAAEHPDAGVIFRAID